MKLKIVFIPLILAVLFFGCQKKQAPQIDEYEMPDYEGKKILIIHSYHEKPVGVMEKNKGLKTVLDNAGVEYKIVYMDTKRNTDEDFKNKAGVEAKKTIEQYQPDAVITFDDNAFKYVIQPYYKDSELPVVFAGIDWDVSIYDAPYTNTTGMISVALIPQLLEYLKADAKGERIAWLGYDIFTARKQTKAYQEILGVEMSVRYVENFEDFKSEFLKLQSESDIMILSGILADMEDWDEAEAGDFVLENIKIPIGTVNQSMMPVSLFGLLKIDSEQGEWSAKTALEIIEGRKPSDIPLARNKKGKIILNLDLAEKLDIVFSAKILKNAEIYSRLK